jgi:hypothetical protein
MSDRELYQKEFDALMRETDDHATYANYLRGVDNLAKLFECAKSVGIEESEVWDIIERGAIVDGTRRGVLDLIDVIIKRSGRETTPKA